MVKKLLIDAIHFEETRVAVIDDNILFDFESELSLKKSIKGNVYLAKVVRIEPALQAAFIYFGSEKHGFLSFSEIHPDYYKKDFYVKKNRLKIQDVIKKNQIILVQAVKEERGTKGAAFSTYISIAGRYCILMPKSESKGISRK